MKGKELAITLGVMYDKRALIRSQAESITSGNQDDKLKALEDKFNEFASVLKGETFIAERVEENDA